MSSRSTPGSRQLSPLRSIIENGARTPQLDPAINTNLDPTEHPALNPGGVAVITGAASGIGLAAAHHLAEMGLRLVLADVDEANLAKAGKELAQVVGEANVITVLTDVSKHDEVVRLKERAFDAYGEVTVLMNNAGIGLPSSSWTKLENWKKVMDTNFWGVVNVQHVFAAAMIVQENPSIFITTGSKQGITNPPGNPAYNASKAAVKSLTEQLAFELHSTDEAQVSAHLFVPGWTFTGMTQGDHTEKPAGAWTAQQTVQYLFERVRLGDFYIIVPDNETTHQLDRLRMRWAAEDVAENRPALSRWHPEWKARFDEHIRDGMEEDHRRRKSPFRKLVITEGDAGVE